MPEKYTHQNLFDPQELWPLFRIDYSVKLIIWDLKDSKIPTHEAPVDGPIVFMYRTSIKNSVEARTEVTKVKSYERMHQSK